MGRGARRLHGAPSLAQPHLPAHSPAGVSSERGIVYPRLRHGAMLFLPPPSRTGDMLLVAEGVPAGSPFPVMRSQYIETWGQSDSILKTAFHGRAGQITLGAQLHCVGCAVWPRCPGVRAGLVRTGRRASCVCLNRVTVRDRPWPRWGSSGCLRVHSRTRMARSTRPHPCPQRWTGSRLQCHPSPSEGTRVIKG